MCGFFSARSRPKNSTLIMSCFVILQGVRFRGGHLRTPPALKNFATVIERRSQLAAAVEPHKGRA